MNTTTENVQSDIFSIPLVDLVRQYLASGSREEKEMLSDVFLDTNEEYLALLTRIDRIGITVQRLKDKYPSPNSPRNYDEDSEEYKEYKKRYRLAQRREKRCYSVLGRTVKNLVLRAVETKPLTLDYLVSGPGEEEFDFSERVGLYNLSNRPVYNSLIRKWLDRYTPCRGFLRDFIPHPQFVLDGQGETSREKHEYVRKVELLIHKVIRTALSDAGRKSDEVEEYLSFRKKLLDYKDADEHVLRMRLVEMSEFIELRSRLKHFAQSNVRDEYFTKALSLAKTKEELYFVVKHGTRCACWPKAVRRLAKLKDLSPFERKR